MWNAVIPSLDAALQVVTASGHDVFFYRDRCRTRLLRLMQLVTEVRVATCTVLPMPSPRDHKDVFVVASVFATDTTVSPRLVRTW